MNFNFDKFTNNTDHKTLATFCRALQYEQPFPMFNPDRTEYYIHSLDVVVKTDNSSVEEIMGYLRNMKKNYDCAIAKKNWKRAWIIKIECQDLYEIVFDCTGYQYLPGSWDEFLG